MNRIELGIVTALLAAAIAFAPVSAAAADTKQKTHSKTGQLSAKSRLPADAPLLGRVVITPTPEQMAKIRDERRMMQLERQATDNNSARTARAQVAGAL